MWTRDSRLVAVIAGIAVTAVGFKANAATFSASEILGQFNAVVFGNFNSSSDVEGRTVIGGDMNGGATFYIKPGPSAASSYSALTVYGNETSGSTFNVNNGGSVTIAGSSRGSFNLNSGGSISIGGGNSGGIQTSNRGAITIGGANSGTLNATSSSVFVGGSNNANVTVNGTGSASVVGANTGVISVGDGSNVYAGSNGGNITVNGNGNIYLNGNNTNQLTVNGTSKVSIAGDTGNININGGSVSYSGSRTGNQNLNGRSQLNQVSNAGVTTPTAPSTTLPGFASNFQAPLSALSSQLNSLTPNSQVKVSGTSIIFDATPSSSATAVFDIKSSLFAPNSTVRFSLNGASTVVVNVNVDGCVTTVCAFTFANSINFQNPTSYAGNVLWNFVNATGITFSNEFGGTVLAVNATVTNSNPIDGTLVANSYNGNGEIHNYGFTGTLPSPVNAPEPGGLALIGTGFIGLGLARWQRRHRG
jgi:choice-of-anchor A domain-containing protein